LADFGGHVEVEGAGPKSSQLFGEELITATVKIVQENPEFYIDRANDSRATVDECVSVVVQQSKARNVQCDDFCLLPADFAAEYNFPLEVVQAAVDEAKELGTLVVAGVGTFKGREVVLLNKTFAYHREGKAWRDAEREYTRFSGPF
jgi:hypothetical protein